ncbi:MAG: hypothetical protein LC754_05430 [Acidobacteria bacterium]|nr:hypothetical protein [Acidobacteriota bacterium]
MNDAPVAAGDSASTDEDTPLVAPAPGVLSNDADVDSTALTAIKLTDPAPSQTLPVKQCAQIRLEEERGHAFSVSLGANSAA